MGFRLEYVPKISEIKNHLKDKKKEVKNNKQK